MPAPTSLYQEVYQQIAVITSQSKVRRTLVKRLALLVTGIVAAQSVTVAKIAGELLSLRLTRATEAESIERTLGRILSDKRLQPEVWYEPALKGSIDWEQLLRGRQRLVLVTDESSKQDEVHLLRVGLPYWGGCQPLAWDVWPQNVPLSQDQGYWSRIDRVLAAVAALVPSGLEVVMLADRAYDIPGFIDRVQAQGWHWAVRYKANGSGCFRDRRGREWQLKALIRQHVRAPGRRWKAAGWVFKDAGWRRASVVAFWAPGEDEPLVLISDLPPRWELLKLYGVRFWVEPGFRNDKKRGWHWEDCQVRKLEHHRRLLLGMAWASLLTLCLGLQEAKARLAKLQTRRIPVRAGKPRVGKPRPADQSLFTMGLSRCRDWLYHTAQQGIPWVLTDLGTDSWQHLWYQHQSHRYQHLLQTVRP